MIKKYPSSWILIFSNLFPLFGILFFQFDVLSVFLIYWAESGIVGLFSILKILTTKHMDMNAFSMKNSEKSYRFMMVFSKVVLIPFFCVHFGMFMFVHLLFILAFFAPDMPVWFSPVTSLIFVFTYNNAVVIGGLLLFGSHGYSFYRNYLRSGEYEHIGMMTSMFQPYRRIVVMHVTLIFGGFFYLASGQFLAIFLLFMVIKIAVDLQAHITERERFTVKSV